MLIKFTNTVWLNVRLYKVSRIDIDAVTADDLSTPTAYFVRVMCEDGTEEQSDYFKTFDNYAKVKRSIFSGLTPSSISLAVL